MTTGWSDIINIDPIIDKVSPDTLYFVDTNSFCAQLIKKGIFQFFNGI